MNCPRCDKEMSFDEPRLGFSVYVCEECDYLKEYQYGELVFESKPDEPMKPPVRHNKKETP